MKLEIPRADLHRLLCRQIGNLFSLRKAEGALLKRAEDEALDRCERAFGHVRNKYYRKNDQTYFNPFHGGQYATFLYFVAASVFRRTPEARTLADRVYGLNRALHAVDLFYEVRLPDIFFTDHPLGSVIGRAEFGDRFAFAQRCTVGNNRGFYPVLGRNVRMLAGSSILGRCRIGDHVTLAAGTLVKDENVPSRSLVFGSSPHLVIKRRPEIYFTGEETCFY